MTSSTRLADTFSTYSEINVTSHRPPPPIYFWEVAVEKALMLYILPVIILVGTVGNVTSFVVLLRSRMCQSSVYWFLLMLAVADTVVLYVSGFKTWLRVLTQFELLNVNTTACRTVIFVTILSQHLAAWIVVLVTVDRFVAVWFPLKATSWCTVSRAWLVTLITTLIVAAYGVHVFWTFEVRATGHPKCVPAKVGNNVPAFMLEPFNQLRLFTYCLLPFLIILSLNIAIIVRLRWISPVLMSTIELNSVSAAAVATTESTGPQTRPSSTVSRAMQQTKVTYMLLIVSSAWILLTGPYGLFSLIVQWRSTDPHTYAIERLVKCVCFLLMYTNHSINFFIYCLTGRKFRRQLQLLCLHWPGCRRWVARSASVKTLRSNCAELEQLNESTRSPCVGTVPIHQQHQQQLQQQCYVTDAINDVTEHDSDVIECNGKNPTSTL